jgi:hypothetical protein
VPAEDPSSHDEDGEDDHAARGLRLVEQSIADALAETEAEQCDGVRPHAPDRPPLQRVNSLEAGRDIQRDYADALKDAEHASVSLKIFRETADSLRSGVETEELSLLNDAVIAISRLATPLEREDTLKTIPPGLQHLRHVLLWLFKVSLLLFGA